MAQLQKLQIQQAVNTGLLLRTVANMQNTAQNSVQYLIQLSSSLSSQLTNVTKILNSNFEYVDGDLKKSFYNQNLISNTMESRHQKSEKRFTTIKEELAKLWMNPQAPIVQYPQVH